MTAHDLARLRCRGCDESWDVWGTMHDGRGSFDPEGGVQALRCPMCAVVCDNLVELNGEEVGP